MFESQLSLFGGGIILIKATLSNLLIYHLLKRVAHEIELLQNRFLWRGKSDFKPHLINYELYLEQKRMVVLVEASSKEMLLF